MVKDKTNRSVVIILSIVIIALGMILVTSLKDSKDTAKKYNEIRENVSVAENEEIKNEVKEETVSANKIEIKNYPTNNTYNFIDEKWEKGGSNKTYYVVKDETGKIKIEDDAEDVILTINGVITGDLKKAYCKNWTNTLTIEAEEESMDYNLKDKKINIY